jgi:hypothetical protein
MIFSVVVCAIAGTMAPAAAPASSAAALHRARRRDKVLADVPAVGTGEGEKSCGCM